METELFCASNGSTNLLNEYLTKTPSPFSSIAYESASMCLFIENLKDGNDTKHWKAYASGPAKSHQTQVYIGLGWAIAKINLSFYSVAGDLDISLQQYVADGCGYYDGSFKKRQTILNQQLPVYIPAELLPWYDQGMGRSLWYSCNANIEKIKNIMESFSGDRQSFMWKGLGIAVAYVGGCDDRLLSEIFKTANEHSVQLALGAALAVNSRIKAGTEAIETERCSKLWSALAANEAGKFYSKVEIENI